MVDFLVLGNFNAVTYKDFFYLINDGIVMCGYNRQGEYMYFEVPDDYEFYGKVCKEENNKILIGIFGLKWFTNIRDNDLPILELKKYIDGDYKKFDNYDAINIDKIEDIPSDYDGVMGVPITFIEQWNHKQFEIVGFRKGRDGRDLMVDGEWKYIRILIKKK